MYAAVACLVAGAEAFGYKGVTVATEPPAAAPTALAAYLAPCDDAVVVSDWAELEAAVSAARLALARSLTLTLILTLTRTLQPG